MYVAFWFLFINPKPFSIGNICFSVSWSSPLPKSTRPWYRVRSQPHHIDGFLAQKLVCREDFLIHFQVFPSWEVTTAIYLEHPKTKLTCVFQGFVQIVSRLSTLTGGTLLLACKTLVWWGVCPAVCGEAQQYRGTPMFRKKRSPYDPMFNVVYTGGCNTHLYEN